MNYENILLKHNKSVAFSRQECSTVVNFAGKYWHSPVIPSNMQSIMTPEIYRKFLLYDWFPVYHRIGGPQDVVSFVESTHRWGHYTSISIGVTPEWKHLLTELELYGYKINAITVDVALSYNDNILSILDTIKGCFPDTFVILGNGSTGEWIDWCNGLHSKGLIDAVKVGVGVSQSCRTRQYTGFGSTTVDSLIECKKAAADTLKIVSDGGITVTSEFVGLKKKHWWSKDSLAVYKKDVCVGDVAKALVLGADMVMSGALFAYCKDVPAATTGYYGNASARAKGNNHHVEGETLHSEILRTKTVEEQMKLITDSLRSSISYSGGKTIGEMKKLTEWSVV